VTLIGDGALSAGMAYEAMNNAGAMNSRLIVVLNDNDMSIAPPVGAIRLPCMPVLGPHLSLPARSASNWPRSCPRHWKSAHCAPKSSRVAW
jgi:hypothetical protein